MIDQLVGDDFSAGTVFALADLVLLDDLRCVSEQVPLANARAGCQTLCPKRGGKKRISKSKIVHSLFFFFSNFRNGFKRNLFYLEDFGGFAWRIAGVAGTAERVGFFAGAVVADTIEAVMPAPNGNGGVLLVILLDETLHHFRQTRRARFEIVGAVTAVLAARLHFLAATATAGDLVRRRISENAGEIALEEALESRLHHWLDQLNHNPLRRYRRINRLNFHRKRHDNEQQQKFQSLNSSFLQICTNLELNFFNLKSEHRTV